MKKIITLLALSIIASLFSAPAVSATGVSVGQIKKMLWYEGHTGLLVTQPGMSDLGGCGRADFYVLDDQHPYFEEIYSLILSAHISGQPLELTINGCAQGISKISHVSSTK